MDACDLVIHAFRVSLHRNWNEFRNRYFVVLNASWRSGLSSNETGQREDIINRLILDAKALVLLSESDEKLVTLLRENVLNSHDEQVAKFVSLIKPVKNPESVPARLMTAIGELILASFLIFVGLSVLAPSLMGLQSPNQLLAYFSELVSGISATSLSNPVIPVLDFVFSLLLLFGSFYLLRHASVDLKEAGLS